jgi:hypothetical protein
VVGELVGRLTGGDLGRDGKRRTGKMSIYVQLLDAALDDLGSSADGTATSEALAELIRRRSSLSASGSSHSGKDWATGAVAVELSYDVSLIRLSRLLGIECEAGDFEVPGHGRDRIELALASRGVQIDQCDSQTQSERASSEGTASGS